MTEKESSPKNQKELLAYIRKVLKGIPDVTDADMKNVFSLAPNKKVKAKVDLAYNRSAEAMELIAAAAFRYASHKVGASGFQAGWAALRFYGDVMLIKGPVGILKAEDYLYPQYDIHGKAQEFYEHWLPWLREEAAKRLKDGSHMHPRVREHMKRLEEGEE